MLLYKIIKKMKEKKHFIDLLKNSIQMPPGLSEYGPKGRQAYVKKQKTMWLYLFVLLICS